MNRWKQLAAGLCLIGVVGCAPAHPLASSSARAANLPGEGEMKTSVERVVDDMDAAFHRKDVEGLVGLFAEDGTLESYVVGRVLHREDGVARGRAEIRQIVSGLMERGVPWGGHAPPIVGGDTVVVEFRTKSSDHETYSVDVIEVRDGKIRSLRAYAGWRALAGSAPPRSASSSP